MIYYIFYELIFDHSNQDWWLVKGLNVFQYVTFRTAYASVTALLISLVFGRNESTTLAGHGREARSSTSGRIISSICDAFGA